MRANELRRVGGLFCHFSPLSLLGLWKCHIACVAMQTETLVCCNKKMGGGVE